MAAATFAGCFIIFVRENDREHRRYKYLSENDVPLGAVEDLARCLIDLVGILVGQHTPRSTSLGMSVPMRAVDKLQCCQAVCSVHGQTAAPTDA